MADKKPAKKQPDTKDLDKKVADLRKEMLEQLRAIKTGTSSNVRKATQIRREIARTLTLQNQEGKES